MMKKEVQDMKRRSFLKLGLSGFAGLAAAHSFLKGEAKEETQEKKGSRKFVYRTLGKTGIKVSIVSMGVMNSDNPNLIRTALDSGIILLDTAHSYQRGRNEEVIGQVLKGRPRDSYVISTKVPSTAQGGSSAESVIKSYLEKVDISLKRLGLEHVDILHVHDVGKREDALHKPILQALEKAKKDGKTRFVGLSTHGHQAEAIRAAIESKFYDVVLAGYNFRQDDRLEIKKAIAEAAAAGLGIMAMKTQAGAYWDKERQNPINMRAALKWVLNDPNVHTAIPGFTTFDQLEEDLSVMENPALSAQEIEDLKLKGDEPGLFCQSCEQCLAGCAEKLPIPSLMRSYMYAYGYRNLSAAHELLTSLNLPKSPCARCSACTVRCAKGFAVADRVKDVVRLREIPSDFLA